MNMKQGEVDTASYRIDVEHVRDEAKPSFVVQQLHAFNRRNLLLAAQGLRLVVAAGASALFPLAEPRVALLLRRQEELVEKAGVVEMVGKLVEQPRKFLKLLP